MGAFKYEWSEERDRQLRILNASGLTLPKIAKELGVSYAAVQRRLGELGVKPAFARNVHKNLKGGQPPKPVCAARKAEVSRQQDIRRGFAIPTDLQAIYFELLKQGLTIAEARERLGL